MAERAQQLLVYMQSRAWQAAMTAETPSRRSQLAFAGFPLRALDESVLQESHAAKPVGGLRRAHPPSVNRAGH